MSALTWAVAAVVTDRAGRVLLCRQSGHGRRWGLPGGRLRRDESPVSAAVREIRAETGWQVDLVDLVGLYRLGEPGALPSPAGRRGAPPGVLVHVFRARLRGDAPAGAPVGGCDLHWHAPDALPAALTPTTRAAVADALAGRSGVLGRAGSEPVAPGPRGGPDGTPTASGQGSAAAGAPQ